MAATPRPDGLYDVTMDTGQTVPMNLTPEQLQGLGHEIMPPPGGPSQATAMGPAPKASGVADVAAPVPGFVDPREAAITGAEAGHGNMGEVTKRSMPPVPMQAEELAEKYLSGNVSRSDFEAQKGSTKKIAEQAAKPEAKVDPSDLDMSGGGGAGGNAFRASPVRRIPGKDVRASYTRRPGQELPEDIKSEFESDRRPEDYEARAQTIADLRDEQQTEREAHLMERRQALEVERAKRAELDKRLGEKEKLISQRESEADKLTPRTAREVWNDKGTFGQLMAAVSVAIGGYLQGSGRTGSNQGLDQLNASIDSEVQGERQKYEDALAKGKVAQNDYAKALELYGSPEAAEQDLTMRRLAIAEKMVENHGQQIGTQESLQAAQEKVGELRQRRAEVKRALYEYEHGQIIQENYVRTADQYVGGTPQLKPEERKRQIRLPGGGTGFVVNESGRQGVQDKITSGGDVVEALGKLQALAGDNTLTDMQKRSRYESMIVDIAPIISVAKGQGAMGDQEFARQMKMLGDPNAILQDRGAALEEAIRGQNARNRSLIRDNVYRDPNATQPVISGRPASTRSNE